MYIISANVLILSKLFLLSTSIVIYIKAWCTMMNGYVIIGLLIIIFLSMIPKRILKPFLTEYGPQILGILKPVLVESGNLILRNLIVRVLSSYGLKSMATYLI